jgi:hypothetical protein
MYVTISLKIEIDASASLSEVPPTIGCCQTRRAQGPARHTPCRDSWCIEQCPLRELGSNAQPPNSWWNPFTPEHDDE